MEHRIQEDDAALKTLVQAFLMMRNDRNLVADREAFTTKFMQMNDLDGFPVRGMPVVMENYDRAVFESFKEGEEYVTAQLKGLIAVEEFVRANLHQYGAKSQAEYDWRRYVYKGSQGAPELMGAVSNAI